jgi:hypothetical protein
VIFMDSVWERATSTSELGVPVMFGTVDEIEDGMSSVWVDL